MGVSEQKAYTKETSQVSTGNTQRTNGVKLSELPPGKIFAGEVVQIDGNKVLLKLENGQNIQASLNGNIKLQEGQMVAFQVKSNNGKQLAIKPMLDVVIGNSSVLKALENAGLPVNAKNTQLVNLLMKEQMPIDKDTIMKFLRQMLLNPQADIKTLVKLQRMGLPITEENIAKFEGYKNHEYRLAEEIKTLSSDVAQLLGESAKGSTDSVELFGKITDILIPEERALEYQKNISGAQGKAEVGEKGQFWKAGPVLYDNLKSEALLKNNGENLNDIQKQALENIEAMVERFNGQESEIEHILENLKVLSEEAEGVMKALEESIISKTSGFKEGDVIARLFEAFNMYETAEKSIEAAKTAISGEEYGLTEGKEVQVMIQEEGLGAVLDENSRMALAQKLQKAGSDIFTYLQIRNGDATAEDLVFMVKNMLEGENVKLPEVREVLQSEEFRKVLQNAIEDQLLLKPEELSKENVKKYYERLDNQMHKLSELIQQMGKAETAVMKNTTAVRQNVEYMNQLNQLYSYVQLPIKLATQNAHSELYVMTNKKRLPR